MQTWRVGNCTVTRIEELIGPLFDPVQFFPDYDPDVFASHRKWLYPHHADEASGNIISSMHSWLIQTPDHNILVDTCIGNDKDRMPFRDWHAMQTPWLNRLRGTGVPPEDIDFVMCTHLHVDHVGWNTVLRDGQWVPTFPNASYVFAEAEYEFWKAQRHAEDPDGFHRVGNKTFDDSVLPVMGLARLISGETELIDDLLRVTPAPGHTPGSITISLTTQADRALFTGDILHHPIQVYEPEWNSAYCEIPYQAIATRRHVLEHCCEHGSLVLPAHFGPSFAGRVNDAAQGFAFEFVEG